MSLQPRLHTLLTGTTEYTLGEGELGDFNKKISFSQEHLQALLYQDKEPNLARSVFTKSGSLRTATPDFQIKQVPIHLTCLCARCTPANLSLDCPSQAVEQQHLVHVAVSTEPSEPGTVTPVFRNHSDSPSSFKAAHKALLLQVTVHPADSDLLPTLQTLNFFKRGL